MGKNIDDLKKNAFKKGQSGNPKGRPKKPPGLKEIQKKHPDIRVIVLDFLNQTDESGQTGTEVLVKRLFNLGMKGSIDAIKILLAYAYDNPATRIIKEEEDPTKTYQPPVINVTVTPEAIRKASEE